MQRTWWRWGELAFVVVAVAIWLAVPAGRDFDPWLAAVVILGLGVSARIQVPLECGFTCAVQPFIVLALFALPLNVVPLVVAAVFMTEALPRIVGPGGARRAGMVLIDSWFIIPPVLVLSMTSPVFDWRHWPVYAAAFAAQSALEITIASVRTELAEGRFPPTRLVVESSVLDLLLTPLGLLATAQVSDAPVASTVVLGCVLGLVVFVSRERQARLNERQDALHDHLTGLPNRRMFREALGQAVVSSRRDDRRRAVLVIDLDGFKEVNDTLGHLAGDEALRTVAERLRGVLREADVLARFGGDEFALLLDGEQDEAGCQQAGDRIREALARPMQVGGRRCELGASIGYAVFAGGDATPDAVLGAADDAMYSNKRAVRTTGVFG